MNAVVYSIHSYNNILLSVHWQLFTNSVESLRRYNKTTQVICYINDNLHLVPEVNEFFKTYSVTPMVFTEDVFFNDKQTRLVGTDNAWHWPFIIHKWPNTIDAIEKFDLECALFVDTDTYFRNDVDIIFKNYPKDRVWYRSEYTGYIPRVLNEHMSMNDGVFLLSQVYAKQIKPYYFKRYNYLMTEYMNQNKPLLSDDEYEQIAWSGWQYITHIILRELSIPTGEFASDQVAFSNEPEGYQPDYNSGSLIIHHYYKTNISTYQPHLMHLHQNY